MFQNKFQTQHLHIVLLACLYSHLVFSQPNQFSPACPSKQAVKKAILSLPLFDKDNRLYNVQTKRWISTNRNWIITVGNVSAKSNQEAIKKAKEYLPQILNSNQVNASSSFSPDHKVVYWTCSWKIKNSSATVTAFAMSAVE